MIDIIYLEFLKAPEAIKETKSNHRVRHNGLLWTRNWLRERKQRVEINELGKLKVGLETYLLFILICNRLFYGSRQNVIINTDRFEIKDQPKNLPTHQNKLFLLSLPKPYIHHFLPSADKSFCYFIDTWHYKELEVICFFLKNESLVYLLSLPVWQLLQLYICFIT